MKTETMLDNNNVEEHGPDLAKKVMDHLQHVLDPKSKPSNFESFSNKEHIAWVEENIKEIYQELPESTRFLIPALLRPGDVGRAPTEKPEWLDMDKFEKGQRFARDNLLATLASALLGFLMVYTFKDGVRAIIVTSKSSTPYESFFRYLRSIESLIISYRSDPWKEGTEAAKDVKAIRKAHDFVRKRYMKLSMEEIDEKSKIPNLWSPLRDVLREDYKSSCPMLGPMQRSHFLTQNRPFAAPLVNQMDMSMTQFGFLGLLVSYPEYFGLSTDEDEGLEAFCYFWRGMGYLYGIEDEYNFCNGSIKEIRERCKGMIEYAIKPNLKEIAPEWEHITRCLVDGVSCYFPATYEVMLLYMSQMINIQMPRLRAAISFTSWIQLKAVEWYFFYISKIPGVVPLINKFSYHAIVKATNYDKQKIGAIKVHSEKIMSTLSVSN